MEYMEDLDTDIMGIIVDDWKPKNGKQAIIKGTNGRQIVIKAIDIKGLLFATVVSAGVIDADGQSITNEEVEKSCWNYQTKVMEKGFIADLNHDGKALEGVKLIENTVDRSSENYSHNIVVNFKDNPELMEKAKNSSIHGVSPKGHARIVEKGEDKGIIKATKDGFEAEKEHIKPKEIIKSEVTDMTKEEIMAMNDEQLKEYGVQKIVTKEPETSQETLEKAELETAPEAITKADFEAYKVEAEKKISDLETEMKEIAKGRGTGSEEIPPKIDVNKMTVDEIKKAIKEDPEGYQALLDEEAEKRIKK